MVSRQILRPRAFESGCDSVGVTIGLAVCDAAKTTRAVMQEHGPASQIEVIKLAVVPLMIDRVDLDGVVLFKLNVGTEDGHGFTR